MSAQTAERLFAQSGVDRRQVGALIHGSVCRDYLEPATAAGVHHALGLPAECLVYDVSNACLGVLNGLVQVATLIELGQIRAGVVVGTENARPLVENTVATLNADQSLTRDSVKREVASLTTGSASVAVLLTHQDLSRTGNRLLAATARAYTAGHALCRGREVPAAVAGAERSVAPLMQTDSEALLAAGIAAAVPTFDAFLSETGWSRAGIARTFCHQVGSAHRKLLLQTLQLDPARDFTTYETLGNTGAAALPLTLAQGIEAGLLQSGDRAALLGIGSGVNVLMLALEWQAG